MVLNIIGICVGSCIALLTIYCSVQARIHTTPAAQPSSGGPSPGTAVSGYNSSASAVSAIWLFFNIWLANTLRASRPQLQFPVIMYSIFANVSSTYAPIFPTMASGIAFVKRLLEAFLTGFGIATAVSLFIFPMTVRDVWFKQSAGFIKLVGGALGAQAGYLQGLEKEDFFHRAKPFEDGEEDEKQLKYEYKHQGSKKPTPTISPETTKMKASISALGELHGKMYADIKFAKREMAYAKLDASDIDELFELFRDLLLPIMGMSSAADIFERMAERQRWYDPEDADSDPAKEVSLEEKRKWNKIMQTLYESFEMMAGAMDEGLQHSSYTLELEKRPKKQRKNADSKGANSAGDYDIEANAGRPKPGDAGFADYLRKKVDRFYNQQKATLTSFYASKGINLRDTSLSNELNETPSAPIIQRRPSESEVHKRNQRQLFY